MHKILLLGSYGRGNVGDDLFLIAIRNLLGDSSITINAADASTLPASIRNNVTVIPTAISASPVNILKTILRTDYVIYGGGDLWVELYGDRFPRQSLYKMVILNLLARVLGKKVFYIGCGAGSVTGYSLWLARLSARLASGVIARDQSTISLLKIKDAQVLPDVTVNLPSLAKIDKQKNTKFTVGIAPLYYIPSPEKNFPILLDEISKLIESLPKQDYRFVIFPMLRSVEESHDDLWVAEQLKTLVDGYDISIYSNPEPETYINAIAKTDMIIGVRLHANILALLSGTPALGIAYRPKVKRMFHEQGMDKYCIDLENISGIVPKFLEIRGNFTQAISDANNTKKNMLARKVDYQKYFEKNFQ